MTRYVALLGSINVGGNRLSMADLREAMQREDFENVETVVASGNVLFDHDERPTEGLGEKIAHLVAERFDIRTFAAVRSKEELERTLADSPFAGKGEDKLVHVHFLSRPANSRTVRQAHRRPGRSRARKACAGPARIAHRLRRRRRQFEADERLHRSPARLQGNGPQRPFDQQDYREVRLMARTASTPEQQSVRVLKVGERVRHILSELLARGEAHDETLTAHAVSVTEVRMTPDLRNAAAYVKPLLGEDEAVVLKALRTNTAFFQREVAKRLGLKFAPKLQFKPDESFDEADRIEKLLADPKVARDLGDEDES